MAPQTSSADRRLCGPRLFSGTPGEQAHGDYEISIRTKRTPQLRHGATLQRCGHDCDRKDADGKTGGLIE